METLTTVEAWNDQTGEWWNVFEANDRNDALEAIATFQMENLAQYGERRRYRIVTMTTEELR